MATKNPKCLCGCGVSTKGGMFRPGHDAKLHGKISRGEIKGNKEQLAVARKNGWKREH